MSLGCELVDRKVRIAVPAHLEAKITPLLSMPLNRFLRKPIPPEMFNDPARLGNILKTLKTVVIEMGRVHNERGVGLLQKKMREIIEGMEKRGCVINQREVFKADVKELEIAVDFAFRRQEDQAYYCSVLNYLLLPYRIKNLPENYALVKRTLIDIFPDLGERPFGPRPSARFSTYLQKHPEVRQRFEKIALPLVRSITTYQQKNWDSDIQPHTRESEESYYFFWAYLVGDKSGAAQYIDLDKTPAGRKQSNFQKQTLIEFIGYRLHALDCYAEQMDADTIQRLAELDPKLKACMRKV